MDFNAIFSLFDPMKSASGSGMLDPFALGNMLATNPEGAIPMLSQLGAPPTDGQPLPDWINTQVAGGNTAGTTAGMPDIASLLSPLSGLMGGSPEMQAIQDSLQGFRSGLPTGEAGAAGAPAAEPIPSSATFGMAQPPSPGAPVMPGVPEVPPAAGAPPTEFTMPKMPAIPGTPTEPTMAQAEAAAKGVTNTSALETPPTDMAAPPAPGFVTGTDALSGHAPVPSTAPIPVAAEAPAPAPTREFGTQTDALFGHAPVPAPAAAPAAPVQSVMDRVPQNMWGTPEMQALTSGTLPENLSLPGFVTGAEGMPSVGMQEAINPAAVPSGGPPDVMGMINSIMDAVKASMQPPEGQSSIIDAFKKPWVEAAPEFQAATQKPGQNMPLGETNAGSLSDWFKGFGAVPPSGGIASPLDITLPTLPSGAPEGAQTQVKTAEQRIQDLLKGLGGAAKDASGAMSGVKNPGAPENRILPPGNASPPHPSAMPSNSLAQLIQALVGRAGGGGAALRLGQALGR